MSVIAAANLFLMSLPLFRRSLFQPLLAGGKAASLGDAAGKCGKKDKGAKGAKRVYA